MSQIFEFFISELVMQQFSRKPEKKIFDPFLKTFLKTLLSLEENLIKDKRNLFRPKKEQNDTAIKDIRNLFRLKKENNGTKDIN